MYTFDSKIRYTECDMDGVLTVESLVDYFQDCSTFQTQLGPATMEELKKDGLAWVISSWQIVINRLPKLGEDVTIGTVPYQIKGFIGLRNFFMDTKNGERVAIANSMWSLIDLEKGIPVRANEMILKTYPLDEKLPMDYSARKILKPEGVPSLDGGTKKIGLHHLDTNNHVNNGQYIRIALQSLEKLFAEGKIGSRISDKKEKIQIRVEYRQQAHLGDEIKIAVIETDECYIICLNDENNNSYAVVEIKDL
ncbi:MAG: acyl-[acyl-carrier-protein] thioesterase [Butyrivibrio sp.]|nr:acyl-[acyl-carrier-protein] thioesterase [Butyrivibrio sp.]